MRPTARFALFGLALTASCAFGEAEPTLPVNTGSLSDDYEMARGVAEAAVVSGGADRDQIIRIIALDRAAVDARNATLSDHSGPALHRAEDAIAAFADYAAALGASREGSPSHISRSGDP